VGTQGQRLLRVGQGTEDRFPLTGWAVDPSLRYRSGAATSLPFSDHADFDDLVSYVEAVNPKRVFTVHGFPHLAAHLRHLGYDATHLDGPAPQKQLSLF
jgi:Cft2 family RNA processing exonuclease